MSHLETRAGGKVTVSPECPFLKYGKSWVKSCKQFQVKVDRGTAHISYLKVAYNTIPSRRIRRKETRKRDIVSLVVYTQILDMSLAAPRLSAAVTEGEVHLGFNTPYVQVAARQH